MKKIISLLLILVFISCNEKKDAAFTVEGNIKNANAKTVYLELNATGQQPVIIDSSKISGEGKFSLTGNTSGENLFSLRLGNDPYPLARIINDSKKISFTMDLGDPTVPYNINGSEASTALRDLEKNLFSYANRIYSLAVQADSIRKTAIKDSSTIAKISSDSIRLETTANEMKEYTITTAQNSKSPVLVLHALGAYQEISQKIGLSGLTQMEVAGIIRKAAEKFPDHLALNEEKKKLRPDMAPEISLPDTTGKMISLSSFRGKYVLVDFWASWCKPCRMENPNVVAAYNQFKEKNFTILGVSLDQEKNAWLKAIKDDQLTWTHISDLQYWNSKAARTYGVNSIPFNVLVDPQGNIIAEGLHGQGLMETLGKVLK